MHEHHRNVPYAAENRSRSPLVAGVTGANASLVICYPPAQQVGGGA